MATTNIEIIVDNKDSDCAHEWIMTFDITTGDTNYVIKMNPVVTSYSDWRKIATEKDAEIIVELRAPAWQTITISHHNNNVCIMMCSMIFGTRITIPSDAIASKLSTALDTAVAKSYPFDEIMDEYPYGLGPFFPTNE